MTDFEKSAFKFLLVIDAIAIIVSMIAGPLERKTLAIACATGAAMISIALVSYAIYFWNKKVE